VTIAPGQTVSYATNVASALPYPKADAAAASSALHPSPKRPALRVDLDRSGIRPGDAFGSDEVDM